MVLVVLTVAETDEVRTTQARVNVPDIVRSFLVYFDRQVAEKVFADMLILWWWSDCLGLCIRMFQKYRMCMS